MLDWKLSIGGADDFHAGGTLLFPEGGEGALRPGAFASKGLGVEYERVCERGSASLTAFAEARPTVPLYVLAEELGKDDVNAVQVFSGLVAEAERSHQLTRLVRGQLVRELSQHLPNGWPDVLDDINRINVAHALARWSTYTRETHEKRVDQVSDALPATPPPPGWRPLGPDDELLRTFLPDEEV